MALRSCLRFVTKGSFTSAVPKIYKFSRLAGHWTIKLGVQTADRDKSFQSLVPRVNDFCELLTNPSRSSVIRRLFMHILSIFCTNYSPTQSRSSTRLKRMDCLRSLRSRLFKRNPKLTTTEKYLLLAHRVCQLFSRPTRPQSTR